MNTIMKTSCLYLVAEKTVDIGQHCLELILHYVSKDGVKSAAGRLCTTSLGQLLSPDLLS
jgi:hypothetical protein